MKMTIKFFALYIFLFQTIYGASISSAPGGFDGPWGVSYDPHTCNIIVADKSNERVQVFNSQGNFLFLFGSEGTGNGQFSEDGPNGVHVDEKGRIYVVDQFAHNYQVFDQCGNFLYKVGSQGTLPGQFNFPADITVNSDGYVYVVDEGNDRVQVFDQNGEFKFLWGNGLTVIEPEPGRFLAATGLDVNEEGWVYVLDCALGIIQVFDPCGNYLFQFGVLGEPPTSPFGISVNEDSTVAVGDGFDGVFIYDKFGNFLFNFGQAGTSLGEFQQATGVSHSPSGDMAIVDQINNRVQVFDRCGNFLFAIPPGG